MRSQRAAAQENYEAGALDDAFARHLAAITAKSWYLPIETGQLLALAEQSFDVYSQLCELVDVWRLQARSDLDTAEASYQVDGAQNQLTIAQVRYSEESALRVNQTTLFLS